jgi:hypothetical protein
MRGQHAGHTLSQIESRWPKWRQMALSYWIRVAGHLNRPETGDLDEKVQESVCPCRFPVDSLGPDGITSFFSLIDGIVKIGGL